MKKILLSITMAVGCLCANAQTPSDTFIAGNLTTPGGVSNVNSWVFLINSNRMNIHSVQLSSAAAGWVKFYDCDQTNAPFLGINYTNNTYWTRGSYPTNLVVTNISGLTGTTNIFTNSGVFTYFTTNNPGTNLLPVLYSSAFSANIAFIQNGLYLTCARGLTIETSTNVSYAIGYTP